VYSIAGGVIAGLLLSSPLFAQRQAKAQTFRRSVRLGAEFSEEFPPNWYLGEGIGVATNSKGHVFVYTRSGRHPPLRVRSEWRVRREIGAGLYGFTVRAREVRVDKDEQHLDRRRGSNMIIKFNPAGRVVMVIGAGAPTRSTSSSR